MAVAVPLADRAVAPVHEQLAFLLSSHVTRMRHGIGLPLEHPGRLRCAGRPDAPPAAGAGGDVLIPLHRRSPLAPSPPCGTCPRDTALSPSFPYVCRRTAAATTRLASGGTGLAAFRRGVAISPRSAWIAYRACPTACRTLPRQRVRLVPDNLQISGAPLAAGDFAGRCPERRAGTPRCSGAPTPHLCCSNGRSPPRNPCAYLSLDVPRRSWFLHR